MGRLGLLVVVLAAGCGRLHFDLWGDGSGAPDVPVDAQLAVDAPVLALDAGECPPTYTRMGSSCYRYSAVPAPQWLDGELACEADGVGAHLVTIDDAAEAAMLATAFNTNDFWIGVTDLVEEGVYRNVTGELAPYLNWRVGEPSSSDCAQLDEIAEFHISPCDTSDEYVCEYDGRPAAAGAY